MCINHMNNSSGAVIIFTLNGNITDSFYSKFLLSWFLLFQIFAVSKQNSTMVPLFQILYIISFISNCNTVVPFAPNSQYCSSFYSKIVVMVPFISNSYFQMKLHHGSLCSRFSILSLMYHILNTVPHVLNSGYWFEFFSLWSILFEALVISKHNFLMVPCVSNFQCYYFCSAKFLILLLPLCRILSTVFPSFEISVTKKECTSLQKSICTFEVTINSLNVNP